MEMKVEMYIIMAYTMWFTSECIYRRSYV